MTDAGYDLKSPDLPADWRAYHEIRRVVLFEDRGIFGVYRDDHPDERAKGNHPFLLTFNKEPIGTLRIDCQPDGAAILRLVAIATAYQGRGHGRELLSRAEAFARVRGAKRILVNAAVEALGFYSRAGYRQETWRDPYGPPRDSIQLANDL